jgi:hypothetical protein
MFPGCDYEGLLPVDEEGYLLPVEMTEDEAGGYPKISAIDTSPAGPPGTPWGDVRVAQAAQIAGLLADLWKPLELYCVEAPVHSVREEAARDSTYVLVTRKRRRFDWGSAPGNERTGEDSAAEKVVRLRQFLKEHGPLDALELDESASLSDLIDLRHAHRPRPSVNH